MAWSRRKLLEAGRPRTLEEQAKSLLYAIRREKFYIPDPVDAEAIMIPDCLLADCSGLSMDGGDCDDLAAALAAAMSSVGIPTAIVGQAFDDDQNFQHVLVACDVGDGEWYYADPSETYPFGHAKTPSRELWLLVPSGKVLCDNSPGCMIEMQGKPAQTGDRPSGDFVGVGDAGSDLVSSPSSSSWEFVKFVVVFGLAGYGAITIGNKLLSKKR
jgi:transglutaminase-like putative cysteine protease